MKCFMLQCMLGTINQNSAISPSKHCGINTLCSWIFCSLFMLRVDLITWIFCLIVTIVEIHMLYIDVCVRLSNTIDERFLCT